MFEPSFTFSSLPSFTIVTIILIIYYNYTCIYIYNCNEVVHNDYYYYYYYTSM